MGRPLAFSVINETAKHVELEAYFPTDTGWSTTYFVVPPLAHDGLGYTLYIHNDSVGQTISMNDIKNIHIFEFPYEQLRNAKTIRNTGAIADSRNNNSGSPVVVSHPNPALYRVEISGGLPDHKSGMTETLILSQSYDDGWLALLKTETFPYFVPAGKHVMVNNWENGWELNKSIQGSSSTSSEHNKTIILFFWPQLLEWAGFLLIPIPFLFILRKKS
jgi:hypothetical protein